MILEAEWVLPITAPPIYEGAVRVEEGEIVDLGLAQEIRARHPADQVTNFHHAVLLPGFVNVHAHLEYSVFRGLFDNLDFGRWMLALMGVKRKMSADDYRASALLGAMECASSGITSVADTVFEGSSTIAAANACGLRMHAFLEVFGMDDTKIPGVVRDVENRLEALGTLAGPLVTLGLSPHAPYTVSGALYQALTEYAAKEKLKVATHVAESQAEVTFVRNGAGILAHDFRELIGWDNLMWMPTGATPVKYLAEWEAFNSEVIAIHCVQVTPDDIEVLAKHDVAVAHCPKSNAKLACGIAPLGEFLAQGLRVGIGTDSLASNNILDMFDEMRMAILLHRASANHVSSMTAEKVLELATLGGARVLRTDEQVGSLEKGKRADLIAVDMEHSHFAPIDDPVSALVYGANQEDVFFTMVNGRTVYEKKVFRDIDAGEVARDANAVRAKLRS